MPDDVAQVLLRLRELAAYVREPDAVVSTEELLHQALLGEQPRIHAQVVEQGGAILRIATWFPGYSTWPGATGCICRTSSSAPTPAAAGYGFALLALAVSDGGES